ncbi:MAG TPA: radical SAM family heme chaperone HemW [Alphaproteobacteria bacterium]|nr:radical SAM family heme chaperone HemW [Alphaproteobacteria bacterium]
MSDSLALYVHWPFCKAKCPYCDFNVHLNNREDDATWISAYLKALASYASRMGQGRVVESIFFGGGTPSLMAPALVAALLDGLTKYFKLSPTLEVTLEANTTSSEMDKFRDFKTAGVNRLSVGVQALNAEDLAFLGRQHSAEEGLKAIDMAQTLFTRSSFDLIYARPGQTLQAWEAELDRAITLAAGHLSLYELTIEERTAFHKRRAKGEFTLPDDDTAADFYTLTFDKMAEAGMPAYEISNYGAKGQECRYNMMTWEYKDYIGIGPGAHGRITKTDGTKWASLEIRTPAQWLTALNEKGTGAEEFYELTPQDIFEETIIAGLRMTSGMPFPNGLNHTALESFKTEGWIEYDTTTLRLTPEGLLRYDAITRALLSGSNRSSLTANGRQNISA